MEKEYHNLTDIEQYLIKEYISWKKSDAPIEYKLTQLELLMVRIVTHGLLHLINEK